MIFSGIHLLECAEKFSYILLLNSLARIFYRNVQFHVILADSIYLHCKTDISFLREFRCVIHQIDNNLTNPQRIPIKFCRNVRVYIIKQLHRLTADAVQDNHPQVAQHLHKMILFIHKLHFSGFYFGHIQQIVDNGKQRIAGITYIHQVFPIFGR